MSRETNPFTSWCSKSKLPFIQVESSRKSLKNNGMEKIRPRTRTITYTFFFLFIIIKRYTWKLLFNLSSFQIKHQHILQNMADQTKKKKNWRSKYGLFLLSKEILTNIFKGNTFNGNGEDKRHNIMQIKEHRDCEKHIAR